VNHSLTYYLTLFVIKLKGVKKNFSTEPIDYRKIRKEDVHKPKGQFFKKYRIQTFKTQDSLITELGVDKTSNKLLILVPGGAFISGPAQHHWEAAKQIAKRTYHIVWVCDYPKAPENQIPSLSENIDAIYTEALTRFEASNICLMGDSVGSTLISALTQRLIRKSIALPALLILITPVMDAGMTNPEIQSIEPSDPMLAIAGVRSAKKMCAGSMDLKKPMISPLYGSFEKFPRTILCQAQNDIMYPDAKLLAVKMKKANVELEVIEGVGMPHIWPLLPLMKEAKTTLDHLVQEIHKLSSSKNEGI